MVTTERVTKGQAEAVLNAAGTGGGAIKSHHTESLGAPADIELRASLRPFRNTVFDRRHYCAEDWHTIVALDFEGGDATFTEQDARVIMGQIVFEFLLDGDPLATTRLPIKRLLVPQPFFEVAYYFQQGVVMSPTALTVGRHTLKLIVTDPSGTGEDQCTFYIDAPGTGACIQ
jgi:hypothetical protein